MAENKTTRNDGSVQDFLASIPQRRRADALEMCELMGRVDRRLLPLREAAGRRRS